MYDNAVKMLDTLNKQNTALNTDTLVKLMFYIQTYADIDLGPLRQIINASLSKKSVSPRNLLYTLSLL